LKDQKISFDPFKDIFLSIQTYPKEISQMISSRDMFL
jgi:hypothetical protein